MTRRVNKRGRGAGGRQTSLAATAAAMTSGHPMMGPDGEWFGPGRPLPPMAPRNAQGRRFDFMFGQNLNITPRQTERHSFQALRSLADGHDLTRLAIETCKDRMVRLQWGFRVLDSDDDLTPEQDARAKKYRKMLRRPDGKHFWVDWLRMVLEDLLVIDAPAIFVRRTVDETEVVGLVQIDGATVKPVIDQLGNEPEPPETAYQQVLHGMPALNYTSAQLLYAPRNRRVHTVYGFSPVEQIIATINIALRRQLWQHSYFTDGNIPDSLIGVPSTWTPDQIRDFQDWFDSVLQGNSGRRRGGVFVPGEVAKSYVPTKDAEMFGGAEEWLARVVCFCFGIPHQALVKEVNRATADNAHEQAIEDGLAPVMAWVKSLMDRILLDTLGEEELEFWWQSDKAIDPKVQDDIWKGRVEAGTASRNEWRTATGQKPRTEDEADMLLYQGKPLGVADQIAQQQTRTDSGVFPSMPGEEESSDEVVASGEEGDEADKAASSSLVKGGQSDDQLPFAKAGEPDSEHQTLSEEQEDIFRALSPERPLAEKTRKRLQRTLERALSRQGRRVVAAVRGRLESLSKADEPDTQPPPVTTLDDAALLSQFGDDILRVAIDGLGSWDFVIDGVSDALEDVAEDAARQVVAIIGSSTTDDMVDQVSALSVRMAEERAAELVGRRILADGSIIDNPSARWAISASTRTMIHDTIVSTIAENRGSDHLIEQLEQAHAFSPARAEMVSRTEIASINSSAHMLTYRAAQDAGVDLGKSWLLGPKPCSVCIANAEEGVIPLEQSFSSGDDTAPAHPNCVCVVSPEVR